MKNKLITLLTLLSFTLSCLGETVSISTPADLIAFANRVNAGELTLDAVLTADIDLQGVEVAVIGNSPTNAYKGTFDGQNHKITNYSLTVNGGFTASYGYGMFGNAKGATIKNFTIDGTIIFDNKEVKTSDLDCALIGWPEAGTLIQNIKSTMTIDAKISTHVGGIVGSLRDATIDRCEFAGTLNGYSSSNGVGGITGYTNLGTITNCIFSGTITGTGTGYFAGVLGYVNNGNAVMKNCLSYGSLKNTTSSKKGSLVSYLRNISKYSNNFYKEGEKGIGGGELATTDLASANTIVVTDAQLVSGEVTCKLGTAFRQTLGTDAYPKIGTDNDIVILNGTYQNITSTLALHEDKDFDTGTDFDVESVTVVRTLNIDGTPYAFADDRVNRKILVFTRLTDGSLFLWDTFLYSRGEWNTESIRYPSDLSELVR